MRSSFCRAESSKQSPTTPPSARESFARFEVEKSSSASYQFARNKAADVAHTPWDLVVIDEAHRLRNVYKPSNVVATRSTGAHDKRKLLLTATPLQNSLLELFGLVSFIDEHTFGDLKVFVSSSPISPRTRFFRRSRRG